MKLSEKQLPTKTGIKFQTLQGRGKTAPKSSIQKESESERQWVSQQ